MGRPVELRVEPTPGDYSEGHLSLSVCLMGIPIFTRRYAPGEDYDPHESGWPDMLERDLLTEFAKHLAEILKN